VAVGILRDDLLLARWSLDCDLKHAYLLQMLQWRMECDQGWAMLARARGKRLGKLLPADVWDELHGTYAGGSVEANWTALLQTMALFGRVAREVGDRLGYAYPDELDARVTAYVHRLWDTHAESCVAAAAADIAPSTPE
jgi:aminoglycoside 6-adenylyltransferase